MKGLFLTFCLLLSNFSYSINFIDVDIPQFFCWRCGENNKMEEDICINCARETNPFLAGRYWHCMNCGEYNADYKNSCWYCHQLRETW